MSKLSLISDREKKRGKRERKIMYICGKVTDYFFYGEAEYERLDVCDLKH